MKIWHQSFTVLENLPAYAERMRQHARHVLGPTVELVLHGQLPGTYPSDYPVDDIGHVALNAVHEWQWVMHALNAERDGFDGFAMCTIGDPLLREIRTLIDLPVVGYGEASFHLACMLGQRFAVLVFSLTSVALLSEHIDRHGLRGRSVGVMRSGIAFREVIDGYADAAAVIDKFKLVAREAIRLGADVIIPGEMPLNVLLATEGVHEVDGAPVLDGLAATLKMTQMMIELRKSVGLRPSRQGFFGARPDRKRVMQVLEFYGLHSNNRKSEEHNP